MRIEMLYDAGTAAFSEDRIILSLPFVGVADGVSGLYLPEESPTLFNGRTGGQMAADYLAKAITSAPLGSTTEEIFNLANTFIHQEQAPYGFYGRGEIECLAGTTLALAKIDTEEIEILQCGDCMALWVTSNGKVEMTPNQVFSHEMEMRTRIVELMRKHGNDRNKMWQEFTPILATMRRQRVNRPGGYGLLNGQREAQEMWQRLVLRRQDIALLLLFTDGLVYPEESGDEDLGQRILVLYRGGGLDAILAETRRREERERDTSHIDHAEASGVAIRF